MKQVLYFCAFYRAPTRKCLAISLTKLSPRHRQAHCRRRRAAHQATRISLATPRHYHVPKLTRVVKDLWMIRCRHVLSARQLLPTCGGSGANHTLKSAPVQYQYSRRHHARITKNASPPVRASLSTMQTTSRLGQLHVAHARQIAFVM